MPDETAAERTPAVFELPLRILPEDIDTMDHVNNIVYLRWVQEAATAHWNAGASDVQKSDYVWVVIRHEIDYLRPAMLGDSLTARTHVGELTGAKFDRHVEIWRGGNSQLIARARSVWVALDARTGRPRRVTEELRSRFYVPPEQQAID